MLLAGTSCPQLRFSLSKHAANLARARKGTNEIKSGSQAVEQGYRDLKISSTHHPMLMPANMRTI